jgi:hypothetical protein
MPAHTEVASVEAPSFDALRKFSREPEVRKLGAAHIAEILPTVAGGELDKLPKSTPIRR